MVLKGLPIILLVAAPSAGAADFVVDHTPVACMLAGKYAEIDARLPPGTATKSVRVYFRAANASYWSSVEMKAAGDVLRAALPKPPSDSREVYYYLEARDFSLGATRSTEYLAEVVAHPDLCADRARLAKALDSASPVVEKGPAVALVHAQGSGSSAKWIVLGALGAGAAAGIATRAGHPAPLAVPNGTYKGTMTDYFQSAQSNCDFWQVTHAAGTISITVSGSAGSASFSYASAGLLGNATTSSCPAPPMNPIVGQFSSLTVNAAKITGTTNAAFQSFTLTASLVNGSLEGAIAVNGGPPGYSWSAATATFNAPQSQ
jgi:hypothetical protein